MDHRPSSTPPVSPDARKNPSKPAAGSIFDRKISPPANLKGAEATQRIKLIHPFPKKAAIYFDPAHLQQFQTLIRSPHIMELDIAMANDEIRESEMVDFILVIPEFAHVQKELSQLAERIGKTLGARVIAQLEQNTVPSIRDLYNAILAVTSSQHAYNVRTFRNRLIQSFAAHVIEQFTLILLDAENTDAWLDHQYSSGNVKTLGTVINEIQTSYFRLHKRNFPGALLRDSMRRAKNIFDAHKKIFKQFMSHGNFQEIDTDELSRETQTLFDEVYELANIAPISGKEVTTDDVHVRIVGHDKENLRSRLHDSLFLVGLVFGPREEIALSLDRNLGEFVCLDTHTSLEHAIGRRHYLRIKKRLLEIILEHLDDPDSIYIAPTLPRASQTIDQTLISVVNEPAASNHSDECHPDGHSECGDEFDLASLEQELEPASEPIYVFRRETTSDVKATLGLHIDEIDCASEEAQRADYRNARQHLRGMKQNRVEAVLTSLLGEPRISGGGSSHHTFQGRNGKSVTIALSGGGDVPAGFLRQLLRNAGISIEEFVARY